MKRAPYYIPIAVHENSKKKALSLINEGYTQANQTVQCPICGTKYLFLCDHKDSGRSKSCTRKHDEALQYFKDKVRESHASGHFEDVLVLPYELHMISSSSETPTDRSERKTG